MRTITFEITDVEQKVLAANARLPQEWVENAVSHLVALAKDEIVQKELARMIEDPNVPIITTDRDEIIRNYSGPLKGDPNA
jgi:hypothetical protein